jgi:hypothetical protein
MKHAVVRTLALAGTLLIVAGLFLAVVRPAYLNWGATSQERRRLLPGDEIVPDPGGQDTRAITIEAPIEDVWPWIAQLGQDRGGFYSFDLLENLFGCEMTTTDVLRAHNQRWEIGDKLWMYPPEKAGGAGFATLRTYIPGRVLGFATRRVASLDETEDGSWTFILEPMGSAKTRLIVRARGPARVSLLGLAFDRGIFEPVHFVMERRMMVGLRALAETGWRSRRLNHVHVVLWVLTFGLFLQSGVRVVRQTEWRRPLLGFVAAAAVFQILTLGQPPLIIGVGLMVLLIGIAWQPGKTASAARTPAGLAHSTGATR